MISDDFIETVITPETEDTNTMISRQLYGMEAVAQFNDELLDAQAKARGQERGGGDN